MEKNVLIVNFNTQKLTEACIRSVNKFTPGCKIYVFDNSDKEQFVNNFKNVEVIDNTKGQIINFDEWLEQYPDSKKSGEATRIHGSAKHCYSIEKCMSMIDGGFVLLDSDVLIKKDFSDLYDEDCVYVGDAEVQPRSKIKRVFPYICYINTKKCIENNIHYFDETKMHGLRFTITGDGYDTGAAFFLNSEKFPHRYIKYEDYIIHLKGGSWFDTLKTYTKKVHKKDLTISPDEWLEMYRYLWDETPLDEVKEIEIKSVNSEQPVKKEPKVVKLVKKEEPKPVEEPEKTPEEKLLMKVKPQVAPAIQTSFVKRPKGARIIPMIKK